MSVTTITTPTVGDRVTAQNAGGLPVIGTYLGRANLATYGEVEWTDGRRTHVGRFPLASMTPVVEPVVTEHTATMTADGGGTVVVAVDNGDTFTAPDDRGFVGRLDRRLGDAGYARMTGWSQGPGGLVATVRRYPTGTVTL